MTLLQAIAAQAAWQKRPLDLVPAQSNQPPRKNPGNSSRRYAPYIPAWAAYARESPRNMAELRDKMLELSGRKPDSSACYSWARHNGVKIRVDVKKIGLGSLAWDMYLMRKAGAKNPEIQAWALAKGFDLTFLQINGVISHAKRKR